MNLQHERIVALCDSLNLPFVAQGYGAATQKAAKQEMAYSDFLEGLLRDEAPGRNVRKQSMMTRLAGVPVVKTLDDFNYDFAMGVKRSQIEELAGLGFVERHENVALVPKCCLVRLTASGQFGRSSQYCMLPMRKFFS